MEKKKANLSAYTTYSQLTQTIIKFTNSHQTWSWKKTITEIMETEDPIPIRGFVLQPPLAMLYIKEKEKVGGIDESDIKLCLNQFDEI